MGCMLRRARPALIHTHNIVASPSCSARADDRSTRLGGQRCLQHGHRAVGAALLGRPLERRRLLGGGWGRHGDLPERLWTTNLPPLRAPCSPLPQIVSGLLQGDRPAIPPRESLPGPDTATWAGLAPYCALMQACWAADPAARPSFAAVIDQLRRLLVAEAST